MDYVKATNFTAKDSLPVGSGGSKRISGTEWDTEFAAISDAIASKLETADLAGYSTALETQDETAVAAAVAQTTTSATAVDSTALQLVLQPNTAYEITALVTPAEASAWKLGMAWSQTPQAVGLALVFSSGVTVDLTTGTLVDVVGSASSTPMVRVSGVIVTHATLATLLKVQFARNASFVSAGIAAGSLLIARVI